MSFNQEEILEGARNLANELKQVNDTLDVAAPIVLPEVARVLEHCKPLAEMIYQYIAGPRFQGAVKVQEVLKLVNTLCAAGMDPSKALDEAKRTVEAAYIELKVF